MYYLKLGFRNIIKNPRRSLITMISVIIGTTACLLTQGFFNWNMNELKEATIHNGIGHYQLFAKGFSEFGNDEPYQFLINNPTPVIQELRQIPEIKTVTMRLAFTGILSSGLQSTVVFGEAGDVKAEKDFYNYTSLVRGTNLSPSKPDGMVMGVGAVGKLSAQLGDTLTLMGNTKEGGLNAIDLELVGMTRSGLGELDNNIINTSLGNIQNLLNIDTGVQKIVVLLRDTKDTQKILPKIKTIAKKYHMEYKTWETLADFYRNVKLMYEVVFYIIILIVLAIVTFTISNTVNMNLNDRVREIGTMRALGTLRTQVAVIFITESSLLGLIGGLAGLILTFLIVVTTDLIGGIPVLIKGTEGSQWYHIFFHPDLKTIFGLLFLFTVVAMVSAVIPARRGAKLSVTQALRWV